MNREILFRGKRKDNGEWVYGSYKKSFRSRDESRKHWIIQSAGHNGGALLIYERAEVLPETVGQFTGLTDKNGNKIFEGDRIIYLPYSDIFKVYWSNETFGWQLECIDSSEGDDGWVEYLSGFDSKDLEIIGNIHDKEASK